MCNTILVFTTQTTIKNPSDSACNAMLPDEIHEVMSDLRMRMDDAEEQFTFKELRNKMLLWHISHKLGNTPIEQQDLKIIHSRVARQLFTADKNKKNKHDGILRLSQKAESGPITRSFSKLSTLNTAASLASLGHQKHLATLKSLSEIGKRITSQDAYSGDHWRNPVVIDILAYRQEASGKPDKNEMVLGVFSDMLAAQRMKDSSEPTHPLITSIKARQVLKIREILTQEGPGVVTIARDHLGNTALHVAAENGNKMILQMILESVSTIFGSMTRGYNPDLLNTRGETPLMIAIQNDHHQAIDMLLNESNASTAIFHVNSINMSTFFFACYAGNVALMDYLAKAGVDTRRCDIRGNSPLHAAASKGHIDAIKYLMNGRGGSVRQTNNARWTALHWAAACGRTEACELLISLGAEINALGAAEETPCFLAFARKHMNAFALLLRLGGDAVSGDNTSNIAKIPKSLEVSAKNDIVQGMQQLSVWPSRFGMKRTFLGRAKTALS